MKQTASYPCPQRKALDGWVLEWKLPKADLVSKERMCFQFLMVYSRLFLYPFLSLPWEHIMAICCHSGKGIFHSNYCDPVSSSWYAEGKSVYLELATFDPPSPGSCSRTPKVKQLASSSLDPYSFITTIHLERITFSLKFWSKYYVWFPKGERKKWKQGEGEGY